MSEGVVERFDRLEAKVDRLSEAVIALARLEERQAAQTHIHRDLILRLDRHDTAMGAIGGRIGTLENARSADGASLRWIERGVWLVITAVGTWLGSKT